MNVGVDLARRRALARSACRRAASSSSMTFLNSSNGCAPDDVAAVDEEVRRAAARRPAWPSAMSASMRALPAPLSSAALNLPMSRPISCAYFSRSGRLRFCWLANSLSCISQNLPCASAATAASAASGASGWNGSGLCRKTTRTLLAVLLLDLLERRDDAAAERALEVGELDDGHLRVRRALRRRPPAARGRGRRRRRRPAARSSRSTAPWSTRLAAAALVLRDQHLADADPTSQHHHQQS